MLKFKLFCKFEAPNLILIMKKTLILLTLVLAIVAVMPLFFPKELKVSVSKTVNAPIEKVYNQFIDLRQFNEWNPWSRKDKNIEINYSNPSNGINSYYQWKSENKNVGTGKMTILDAEQNKSITYDLAFGEIKDNKAFATFESLPDGKTKVTWSFESAPASYPFQVLNLVMKSAVKGDFNEGLNYLSEKLSTEENNTESATAKSDLKPGEIREIMHEAQRLFGIEQTTSNDSTEIQTALAESYGMTYSYLIDVNNLTPQEVGMPVSYWMNYKKNEKQFFAGFIIQKEVKEVEGMQFIELPKSEVLTTLHIGNYNTLHQTYKKLEQYADSNHLKLSKHLWEIYLNDPEKHPESEWKTQIFIPIIPEGN